MCTEIESEPNNYCINDSAGSKEELLILAHTWLLPCRLAHAVGVRPVVGLGSITA